MTNKELVNNMFPYYEDMEDIEVVQTTSRRVGAMEMAEYKDNEFKRVLDNTNFQAFTDFREYIQYIKEQLHID